MSWPLLSAHEGLTQVKNGAPGLDVRAPSEFREGHIPGFFNIPILDDHERHQVGLTYKTSGRDKALALGFELVGPNKSAIVEKWRNLFSAPGLVTCWRGGLRSQIASEWLNETYTSGSRVKGGYKSMRQVLLDEISKERNWIVMGGLTGSGKSLWLRKLKPEFYLDLEALARHRGSAFGSFIDVPQPSQQTFENSIGLSLLGRTGPLVVENESSLIGICSVPPSIRQKIRSSPLVKIVVSFEDRVTRIYQEYVSEPLQNHSSIAVEQTLSTALSKISRTLGGVRFAQLNQTLKESFLKEPSIESHRAWIEFLLREYYDPMYEYGLKRDERPLQFEGSPEEVIAYLNDTLSRWRP